MRKDLHNSPIIFWLLAAIAVGSFAFAIYTFEITKPSRSLSYKIYSQKISFPPDIAERITIKGLSTEIHPSEGFLKEIYIWNSGNLEIEPVYILKNLNFTFQDEDTVIEIAGKNIANWNYEIKNRQIEIKYDKLLPKAGFILRYFSQNGDPSPQVEGLIADPIRGATPASFSSIRIFDSSSRKFEKWYFELFSVLIGPFMLFGSLFSMTEIEPITTKGKLIKSTISYIVIFSASIFTLVELYNFSFGRAPF